MVLVISFQQLTNFTKNPNTGAMVVLNVPLEYYITYSEIFTGDKIKYCGTVVISSYLAKLLNSLIHTEQEAVVLFLQLCL